ncbi:MAG: hypothetical protein JXB10_18475 [Pirellulales bacterium]|nr:hypothetical protein [Pirellulales bacterium]
MKTCDLSAGAAKLELAMESLHAADAEANHYWSDEAHCKFQETYVAPLDPKVRRLLDAIQRLAEVLAVAERQCGMD